MGAKGCLGRIEPLSVDVGLRTEGFNARYFCSGSRVKTVDSVELLNVIGREFLGAPASVGTSSRLTSCPGRKGQKVVEGSAILKTSTSPSRRY